MLLTIVAFIIVIGPLIFVHELGHFVAAKALGVQVIRFSLGIGPPIRGLSFRRGETEYCLSWLPIGGYVSMATLDEQGAPQVLEGGPSTTPIDSKRVFEKRPLWARAIILLAGVTMNALFAFAIYSTIAGTSGAERTAVTTIDTVWTSELPAGAGALGELRRGERITAINGTPVATWEDLLERLAKSPVPIRLTVEGRPTSLELPVRLDKALQSALEPVFPPVVREVIPKSPADRAGIKPGDTVLTVNGDSITTWYQFTRIVRGRPGQALTITVRRAGSGQTIVVTPERRELPDPHTKAAYTGFVGISPEFPVVRVPLGPMEAIREGGRWTLQMAGQVLGALKGLVTGHISLRELGGPIRIAQVSGEAARMGLGTLISLMAALSINLAILNLLPIPVLDGGGLTLLAAEAIRRRPLSLELRTRITNLGFIIVAALMLFAVSNDVFGLFRR